MEKKKSKGVFKGQGKEICWNLINSAIAGSLVLGGSLLGGEITRTSFIAAGVAAFIVFATKFQQYWKTQEDEYVHKVFEFV